MPKKSIQDLMFNEIKEIHSKVDKILEEKIPGMDRRLVKVEVKSGLWGALSGLVAGVLVALGFSK
jgi:hypothetical protein